MENQEKSRVWGSKNIGIWLRNSPEMFTVLENLASLVMNDEVPFLEAEAVAVEPEDKSKASELRALADAYREFQKAAEQIAELKTTKV